MSGTTSTRAAGGFDGNVRQYNHLHLKKRSKRARFQPPPNPPQCRQHMPFFSMSNPHLCLLSSYSIEYSSNPISHPLRNTPLSIYGAHTDIHACICMHTRTWLGTYMQNKSVCASTPDLQIFFSSPVDPSLQSQGRCYR